MDPYILQSTSIPVSHCLVMSSDCCCMVTVAVILKKTENPLQLTGVQALEPEEGESTHFLEVVRRMDMSSDRGSLSPSCGLLCILFEISVFSYL